MNVLHIAAHMGGGIGSAFVGMGTLGYQQSILLLEEPINKGSLARVEAAGFKIIIRPNMDEALQLIQNADVVVFSWMHHPAVTQFLCQLPDVAMHTMLWSHVSGNYFPAVKPAFLRLFHQCAFATPYTMTLPDVAAMGTDYANEHFKVVYGLGEVKRFANVQKRPHDGFVIGYVGTLNFCKLHPRFLDFCAAAADTGAEWVLIGDPAPSDELLQGATQRGLMDNIRLVGYSDDILGQLAGMDAFGYLLNPQHYGATENALLEAMAAGVPVVALDQNVERIIIKHDQTGFLVDSPEAYTRAIHHIRNHDVSHMTHKAHADILERFDIETNRQRMRTCMETCASYEKSIHSFKDFFGNTPSDWFLSAVDADKDCFTHNRAQDAGRIFHEPTKGSPRHYATYFPDDVRLKAWTQQIESAITT